MLIKKEGLRISPLNQTQHLSARLNKIVYENTACANTIPATKQTANIQAIKSSLSFSFFILIVLPPLKPLSI